MSFCEIFDHPRHHTAFFVNSTKKEIRIITFSVFDEHTTPLLRLLNIQLADVVTFCITLFMLKLTLFLIRTNLIRTLRLKSLENKNNLRQSEAEIFFNKQTSDRNDSVKLRFLFRIQGLYYTVFQIYTSLLRSAHTIGLVPATSPCN